MSYILFAFREIIPAGILLIPVYFVLYVKRFEDIRTCVVCYIFSLYLCAVYALVGLPNVIYIRFELSGNLIPLKDMISGLKTSLFNVMLFIPLGVFLPLLWGKYKTMKNTVLFGFGMSLTIELLQIFTYRATDVNDLLTNTLGTVLGCCIAGILSKNNPLCQRLAQAEKNLLLTFVSSVCVMFFLQPIVVALL